MKLGVSTLTACRELIALTFIEALKARLPLGDSLSERMATALHESVTNAVIHGNLNLAGDERQSFEDGARLAGEIDARLASPQWAKLPVWIVGRWTSAYVTLSVSDQGQGFEWCEHGDGNRGLEIIAALSDSRRLEDEGRTIVLEFRR